MIVIMIVFAALMVWTQWNVAASLFMMLVLTPEIILLWCIVEFFRSAARK